MITINLKMLLVFIALFFLFSCTENSFETQVFTDAEVQVRLLIKETNQAKEETHSLVSEPVSPRTLNEDGNLELVSSRDWTSGFFPGVLWFLYEQTGKTEWLENAKKFTAKIEPEKQNGTTHDMGFKIYCSFGNGYRLTGDSHYREVIIESAHTLAGRFNAATGCLRSWDHSRSKWLFPVIIDNMMNLELLFAASRLTGDPSFYQIAVSHADATLRNHFRVDYSSYHVVDFDSISGEILKKNTHQGYSDESAWSRGQAWALYGFTICYRETKDIRYLYQAEHIASYILNHTNLPDDLIPYWDYNAPEIPNEPRDVSAAAITASALYELSTYSGKSDYFSIKADKIIDNLSKDYRASNGSDKGFLLRHSTGSKPAQSEVDVPLIYADYYYLEALLRSQKLKSNKPLFENQ